MIKKKDFKKMSLAGMGGDITETRVQADVIVSQLKENHFKELRREFSLLADYEDVVGAIARHLSQCFKFTIEPQFVETLLKMIALAWIYAEEDYEGRNLESYEGFIECLQVDVCESLYCRTAGMYGIL